VDAVRHVHVAAGETVLRQGDVGHCMYFIQSGTLDVLVAGADGEDMTVASLEAPDFFGERALLAADPRRGATIVARADASEGCELLLLDRATFLGTCAAFPTFALEMERKAAGYDYVEAVPIFKGRAPALMWDILGRVEEQARLPAGATVCTQGDTGHEMYFVKEGTLAVEVGGVGRVHTLGPSDFFGEKALLGGPGAVRTATVTTNEACVLLTLRKAAFEEVLALHPDFRKEVMVQSGVARETIIANERQRTFADASLRRSSELVKQ